MALTKKKSSMILGNGMAVPENILTNQEMEALVDTNDEWIRSRTGIEQRHIANDDLTTSELCTQAAQKAIRDAGISVDQIDLILIGTVTGDVTFPATACFVQEKLGARNAAAIDLQAACSGFLYALNLADGMIASGKIKYALIIGGELLSKIVDWKDRSTCVLFGDGAGAAVLGVADDSGRGIIDSYMKSDGSLTRLLCMEGYGTKVPVEQAIEQRLNYIHMDGPDVFKAAVTAMGDAASIILDRNNLSGNDLDMIIPHQANIRIINMTAKRIKAPREKVYVNVNRFGNTSAASIPLAMAEAKEKGCIQKGDLLLLVAFGGGFTWGSVLLRF